MMIMTDIGDGVHFRIGFGSRFGFSALGVCDGEKGAGKMPVKRVHRIHTSLAELGALQCNLERDTSPLSHEIVVSKINCGNIVDHTVSCFVEIAKHRS